MEFRSSKNTRNTSGSVDIASNQDQVPEMLLDAITIDDVARTSVLAARHEWTRQTEDTCLRMMRGGGISHPGWQLDWQGTGSQRSVSPYSTATTRVSTTPTP